MKFMSKITLDEKDQTPKRFTYYNELTEYFEGSNYELIEKLIDFPKYIPNNMLAKLLVKYELFKKCLDVHGSIIECGVFSGSGVMTFAHLNAILEPYNQWRKIIGFDIFNGFRSLSKKDNKKARKGHYKDDSYDDINKTADILNRFRLLQRDKQISLIKGDICKTVPKYLKENPQLIVSMLYLDCDLYAPTSTAINVFIDRIPKGGIIVFDQLNSEEHPGETIALFNNCDINKLKIQRFPFTKISYVVME